MKQKLSYCDHVTFRNHCGLVQSKMLSVTLIMCHVLKMSLYRKHVLWIQHPHIILFSLRQVCPFSLGTAVRSSPFSSFHPDPSVSLSWYFLRDIWRHRFLLPICMCWVQKGCKSLEACQPSASTCWLILRAFTLLTCCLPFMSLSSADAGFF